MNSNLRKKVDRLNELYQKNEIMKGLTDVEYKEQGLLREELINYYKFAINKHNDVNKKGEFQS